MGTLKEIAMGRWACFWLTMIVWALGMLLCTITQGVQSDVVLRFAPMAERFADGAWHEAFHPRFGVAFPFFTGSIVWLTGCTGLMACAYFSMTLWAWSIPLLFRLMKHVFDSKIAWITVGLYLTSWLLPFWAFCGYRESTRLMGLLMASYAIFLRREGNSGVGWMFGAIPLLALFRTDTFAILLALLLVYSFYDRLRWRSWALVGGLIVCVQPMCYLVWLWTGIWLPGLQFANLWIELFGGGL